MGLQRNLTPHQRNQHPKITNKAGMVVWAQNAIAPTYFLLKNRESGQRDKAGG